MAALAVSNCAKFPRVSVLVTSFEDWQVEKRGFELLISAQAWHWLSAEVRYPKAYQALCPSGSLALFWNRPIWYESSLGEPLAAIYERIAPELYGLGPWFPGFRHSPAADGSNGQFGPGRWLTDGEQTEIEQSCYFQSVVERSYHWTLEHSTGEYLDLLRTLPEHGDLGKSEHEALFDSVAGVIDGSGGTIQMQYETKLYFVRRAESVNTSELPA